MLKYLGRYNLLFLLMLLLFLPGILSLSAYIFKFNIPEKMQPNYKLLGYSHKDKSSVVVDLNHVRSHQTQKAIEEWFADNIPLRSWFIRLNNQFYYSLFKKSYAETGVVIVGKAHQLISLGYITAYCQSALTLIERNRLAQWADKIKGLQNYYQNKGKIFLYLLTPSKAEYMPEVIPNRFHCPNKAESPYTKLMVQLLKERQIPFIDGPQLMTEATQKYHVPMFNPGGIHWNELGALTAVADSIKLINKQSKTHLEPLTFGFHLMPKAVGATRDLLNLLNLAFPNAHYPVPMVDITQIEVPPFPVAVCVGGSFCGEFINMMLRVGIVEKVKVFSYFIQQEYDIDRNGLTMQPVIIPQAIKDIEAADIIILEENSSIRVTNIPDQKQTAYHHGLLFYNSLFSTG